MFSTTYGCKCLYKDRVSISPLLREKSKAFDEDNKLKESLTPPSLFIDFIKPEPGPQAGLIPKYSEQDFQQIL